MTTDITTYNTPDDVNMVQQLMKNPRYDIPVHLRNKIIEGAGEILSEEGTTVKEKIDAAKLVLECDKRNVDFLKIMVPKTIKHEHIGQKSTEELRKIVANYQDGKIDLIPENLR
jgi:hypothetical protein